MPPLCWSPWLPTAGWPGHALKEGRQGLPHLSASRDIPGFGCVFTSSTIRVPAKELQAWSPCRHSTAQKSINAVINLDAKHTVSQSHNIKLNYWFSALRNRASSNFSSDPGLFLFHKVPCPMLTAACSQLEKSERGKQRLL